MKGEKSGMTAELDLVILQVELAPLSDSARLQRWRERKAAVAAISDRV